MQHKFPKLGLEIILTFNMSS